jgi:predicted kinase
MHFGKSWRGWKMERFRSLIGRQENRLDFLSDLVSLILSREELYSNEIIFKDAVEEVYSILKSEVRSGNFELLDAYETAVVLRAVVFKENLDVPAILRKLLDELG